MLSLSGGEAWTITDLPRSAGNPVWSPDGKQIAFLCDATPEDLAKKQKKDAAAEPEHESDVKVITRAIYRFNGTGYIDPKHTQHIWILDLPASADAKSAPRQLTSGAFDEHGPIFTPDGKTHSLHDESQSGAVLRVAQDGHHVGADCLAEHRSCWQRFTLADFWAVSAR